VSGYGKGGIVVDNTGSSATISGNTVSGMGATPAIAQNGIQISRGAIGAVSGNTVNDHFCTSPSGGCLEDPATSPTADGATGILLYASGAGVTISDNILNGNQFGIWSVAAVDASISGNTITGASVPGAFTTGIAIWDSDRWTTGLGYSPFLVPYSH
jgi:parallel beta-helix repeat protein